MQRNFNESYALLAEFEGGWSNNKHDRGGKTHFGITERVYHDWLRRQGMKKRDIRKISRAVAKRIAVGDYYTPVKFDALPDGLDMCVVDFAFNSGPSRAVQYLQSAINKIASPAPLKVDGRMGKKTLTAARRHNGTLLLHNYIDDRLAFLMRQSDAEWKEFGNGWTIRTDKLRAASIGVYERRKAEDRVASPTGVYVAVVVFSGLLWALTWAVRKTIGRIFK